MLISHGDDSFRHRRTPLEMSLEQAPSNEPANAYQLKTILIYRKEIKMKAQEKIRTDEINLQADTLTDLPVTDEQADEAKGGHRDEIEVLSWGFGVQQSG